MPPTFFFMTATVTPPRTFWDADGKEGDGPSTLASISADNNFVAFRSFSTNLVAGAHNSSWDIFVVTLSNGAVEIASQSSDGTQGNPLLSNPDVTPVRPVSRLPGVTWPFIG